MESYKYYTGTHSEVMMYNAWVSFNKRYKGNTEQWSAPFQREGKWYIMKNDEFPSEEMIEAVPPIEEHEI